MVDTKNIRLVFVKKKLKYACYRQIIIIKKKKFLFNYFLLFFLFLLLSQYETHKTYIFKRCIYTYLQEIKIMFI